jgi:hypothetical protein
MFTPGLAIFYLATILRPDHVRGVKCHASGFLELHRQARGSTLVSGPIALSLKGTTCNVRPCVAENPTCRKKS